MQIVVTIDVPDLDQGIAFYHDALGFEERVRPLSNFAVMTNGRARIGIIQKDAGTHPATGSDDIRSYERHWTPVHADFHVEDFERAVDAVERAGGKFEQKAGGGSLPDVAFCSDPFGHGFCVIGPSPKTN